MRVELALDDLCSHLADEELVDGVHLESSAVQAAILPLEFCRSGVILSIVFAASWQPVHIEILELIYSDDRVLVEHAEASGPPLHNIVRKDV